MIGLEELLYVFVCGTMLALSTLGLESAVVSTSLERWDRRFFIAYFADLASAPRPFFSSWSSTRIPP